MQALLAIPNEKRDVPEGTQLQALLAIPNEKRDVPKGTQAKTEKRDGIRHEGNYCGGQ